MQYNIIAMTVVGMVASMISTVSFASELPETPVDQIGAPVHVDVTTGDTEPGVMTIPDSDVVQGLYDAVQVDMNTGGVADITAANDQVATDIGDDDVVSDGGVTPIQDSADVPVDVYRDDFFESVTEYVLGSDCAVPGNCYRVVVNLPEGQTMHIWKYNMSTDDASGPVLPGGIILGLPVLVTDTVDVTIDAGMVALRGVGVPGATVFVSDDESDYCSVVVDSDGNWECAGMIPDSATALSLFQMDAIGAMSESVEYTIE